MLARSLPPANSRVVVVSTAVGHRFRRVVMRQKLVIPIATKRELQNAHSRKAAGIAQRDHIRRDEP